MSERLTRAEVCCVAVAECFRGDGEILANPIGTIPMIGGRLARATFEPDLVDDRRRGHARRRRPPGRHRGDRRTVVEGWNPYRTMFDVVWGGRRHVMMGATQVDRYGNQNIAALGDPAKPKVQLLGFRGAPGNTVNHPTSYFVPNHSPKVFVDSRLVDGVGYDRAAGAGTGGCAPRDPPGRVQPRRVRLRDRPTTACACARSTRASPSTRSQEATGFELVVDDDVDETRSPTDEELRADPRGARPRHGLRERRGPSGLSDVTTTRRCTRRSATWSGSGTRSSRRAWAGWPAPACRRPRPTRGGLGILASATMDFDQLATAIDEVKAATDDPFGVNLRADAPDAGRAHRPAHRQGREGRLVRPAPRARTSSPS